MIFTESQIEWNSLSFLFWIPQRGVSWRIVFCIPPSVFRMSHVSIITDEKRNERAIQGALTILRRKSRNNYFVLRSTSRKGFHYLMDFKWSQDISFRSPLNVENDVRFPQLFLSVKEYCHHQITPNQFPHFDSCWRNPWRWRRKVTSAGMKRILFRSE